MLSVILALFLFLGTLELFVVVLSKLLLVKGIKAWFCPTFLFTRLFVTALRLLLSGLTAAVVAVAIALVGSAMSQYESYDDSIAYCSMVEKGGTALCRTEICHRTARMTFIPNVYCLGALFFKLKTSNYHATYLSCCSQGFAGKAICSKH